MAIKSIACAAIPLLMAAMPTQAVTIEQLNNQVKQLNKRISNEDQRFRINGFASFTASQSDEKVAYNETSDEINFRRHTKAGIQMTFNLDEKTSVITQLVSRGSGDSNFNTQMDWGYIRHNFGNGLSAKFGRIRGPYYLLSEYLDVSYAVPWTYMPAETYTILNLFANVEGADLTWDTNIGDFGSQVQVVYGTVSVDLLDAKELLSVGYTLSGDTWHVRAAHSRSKITIKGDPNNPMDTGSILIGAATALGNEKNPQGEFNAIGVRWEPGDFLVLSEITSSKAPGILADQDSYYLTVGYRIGQWMPHLTVAHVESTDNEERPISAVAAIYNIDTDRISVGARYDVSPGVAMKVQYDMIDENEARGLFDFDSYTTGNAPDSVNVLTFSIDTVF